MLSLSLYQIYFWGLIILISFYCISISSRDRLTPNYQLGIGTIILAIFVVICISQLPVNIEKEGDRTNYANAFINITNKILNIGWETDSGFAWWMKFCHLFGGVEFFFTATAIMYVGSYLWAVKRIIPQYVFPMFLLVVVAFQFYAYGVNTLRAGMALSIVILAFSYYRKWWKMVLLMLIALSIHFSTIIPIIAFLMARLLPRPNVYLAIWVICVAISAVAGDTFNQFFESLTFEADSRASYLTTENEHYKIGFRIDFVIYSCVPILLGYYYRIRKGFKNNFFNIIYSTYILANAFWILVIRANYTDRFAYLSWFIYPIIILYPVLEEPKLVVNQTSTIIKTFLCYSAFIIYMQIRDMLLFTV